MKLGVLTVPLQAMPAEDAFAYLAFPRRADGGTRHRRLHQRQPSQTLGLSGG